MDQKIKVGIVGYGNVGRGVELAVGQNPDMSLDVILTRRNPDTIVPRSSSTKYARAAYKLRKNVVVGAQTVFDIAPKYLSMKSNEELRMSIL